jgi:hypothetical protein
MAKFNAVYYYKYNDNNILIEINLVLLNYVNEM